MIEVKISDLLNSTETLQNLSKKDFKAKTAWQISKILKNAESELQDFNTTRMDLIKKYGDKDDKGELVVDENGNCKISAEFVDKFNAELGELMDSTVELNSNKIPIASIENVDFSPTEMSQLEPFIEMDEE